MTPTKPKNPPPVSQKELSALLTGEEHLTERQLFVRDCYAELFCFENGTANITIIVSDRSDDFDDDIEGITSCLLASDSPASTSTSSPASINKIADSQVVYSSHPPEELTRIIQQIGLARSLPVNKITDIN